MNSAGQEIGNATRVGLGAHFEKFIEGQVKSGRYNNAGEVVRAGLHLLEDQLARARLLEEELRAAIAASLASGHGKAADVVFDRLETKYRKQAGERAA